MIRFILKTSLLIKWIILTPMIAFSENEISPQLDERSQRIMERIKEQQKETIIETVKQMENAIEKVVKVPDNERKRYAVLISVAAKKYDIDPRIIIAILKVESDFKQHAVSHTGDYSVSQINFNVWTKRFNEMKRAPLKFEKLREDEAYSLFRMAEILSIVKKEFEKSDKHWYARYHSGTCRPDFCPKLDYLAKVNKNLKKIVEFGPNMLENLPDNPRLVAETYLGSKYKIKGI